MKDELLQTMVTWKEGSFYPLLPPLPPYDPPSDSDSDTDLREDITVSSKPLSDSAEPNPTVNGKVNGAIVEAIFEHWKVTHDHPRAKLDKKRKALIRSALKNYEEAELCQAITGYLNSPHHMGQNDRNTVYDDISIMLRDSKHIDAGLKFYSDPPRTDLSKRGRANLQVVSEWQPPEIRNATK